MIQLLDSHGAGALEAAIAAALAEDTAHLGAVRHFIDAHARARHQAPPIAVVLPNDPRVRSLYVRAHSLLDYQRLISESAHELDPHNEESSHAESASDKPQP